MEQSGVRRISVRSNHHPLFAPVMVPRLPVSITILLCSNCVSYFLFSDVAVNESSREAPNSLSCHVKHSLKHNVKTHTPESYTTDLKVIKPHVWDLSCSVLHQIYTLKFTIYTSRLKNKVGQWVFAAPQVQQKPSSYQEPYFTMQGSMQFPGDKKKKKVFDVAL